MHVASKAHGFIWWLVQFCTSDVDSLQMKWLCGWLESFLSLATMTHRKQSPSEWACPTEAVVPNETGNKSPRDYVKRTCNEYFCIYTCCKSLAAGHMAFVCAQNDSLRSDVLGKQPADPRTRALGYGLDITQTPREAWCPESSNEKSSTSADVPDRRVWGWRVSRR